MKGVCGFLIPTRGKARFNIEGQVYELEPGIIFHAGSNFLLDKEVVGEADWEYTLIHYRIEGPPGDRAYFENLHYSLNIGINHYNYIIGLAHQLRESELKAGIINRLKSKVMFYGLLENILQHAQEKNHNSDEELIRSVIYYIENNYNKNLTVNDLAGKYNIDSKRFYYLFQKSVGMCTKQYIMRCRINRAKELLMHEQYNICDIANFIGYEDAFHFSRMFKKSTGLSPSDFRKKFGKNSW
jgi:YesN/AraC family two-component response regulator